MKDCIVWYAYTGIKAGWQIVFFRQLAKINIMINTTSNLDLHIIVKGDKLQKNIAKKYIHSTLTDTSRYIIHTIEETPNDSSEYDPIIYIWNISQKCLYRYLAYVHLKGVSYSSREDLKFKYLNSLEWGDFLEWAIIENWEDNLKLLNQTNADILGCNFAEYSFRSEKRQSFSGNFWIAKSTYIQLLSSPTQPTILREKYGVDKKDSWRLYYEYWPTSKNGIYLNAYKSHSINDLAFHYNNRMPREYFEATKRYKNKQR